MYLLHDSLLVVIAQRAAELVVVHGWTVLLHTPQPGHLMRGKWSHLCKGTAQVNQMDAQTPKPKLVLLL